MQLIDDFRFLFGEFVYFRLMLLDAAQKIPDLFLGLFQIRDMRVCNGMNGI